MSDFGPWAPDIADADRKAQLRCIETLVHVFCQMEIAYRDVMQALREAEDDPNMLKPAWTVFERLPALKRRKVVSVFWSVNVFKRRVKAATMDFDGEITINGGGE